MAKGRVRILCFVWAISLVIPGGSLQGAFAADPKQEAKVLFTSGHRHYNLNEFNEALRDFKEAYRLYPDPIFLFNLGQCERQLGHFEEAIRFYRTFLRNKPKAENRQELERTIGEMELALKSQAESEPGIATTPPSPLKEEVPKEAAPGVAGPASPASPTSPASPLLPAAPAANAPATTANQAQPSSPTQTHPVPALITPPPGTSPAASTATGLFVTDSSPPSPAPSPAIYQRWWFWTAAGVVVAGVATFAVISLSADRAGPPSSALGGKKVF